jgi:hypothetical protein
MVDKVKGTFEIHIFCAPINPSNELAAKFDQVCKEETARSGRTMKGTSFTNDANGYFLSIPSKHGEINANTRPLQD